RPAPRSNTTATRSARSLATTHAPAPSSCGESGSRESAEMPADARIQESNPFVEIATHLFLEDLAGKVGVAGLNNYLVSLAKNLATAMPREEYASWSEFLGAVGDGQSTL